MPCESQPCPVGCVHNPPAPLLGSPPDMRAACSCRPRSCGNTHLCSCGVMAAPTGPHSDSERTQHVPVQLWPSCRANRIPFALSCQQEPSRIQLIRNTSPVDLWHHVRAKRQQDFMRSQLCTKPHLRSCGIMSMPSANRTSCAVSCVQNLTCGVVASCPCNAAFLWLSVG